MDIGSAYDRARSWRLDSGRPGRQTRDVETIDLRSDTVTRPTAAMRKAMAEAVVGDDVWGDDPTVAELEARTADLLGKEAGLFVSSGTQSNLCALLAHCARGDEYIVGQHAHTYRFEAGGAAVLGSIQPQPLDFEADGTLDLDKVEAAIKPDDPHFARTRLLALENTHDGMVLPLDYLQAARAFVDEMGLALHLDGARLWNAAAALGVPESEIAEPFDTVSVCLSKGLGAPVGSVLVGDAATIADAHRWRKILGGAMRQVGVIAAAGLVAIEQHRARLTDDHRLAAQLGEMLAAIPGIEVEGVHTNMVFACLDGYAGDAGERMADAGILAAVYPGTTRFVTHLDLPADTVPRVAAALG